MLPLADFLARLRSQALRSGHLLAIALERLQRMSQYL
jgi:hypothetical protein